MENKTAMFYFKQECLFESREESVQPLNLKNYKIHGKALMDGGIHACRALHLVSYSALCRVFYTFYYASQDVLIVYLLRLSLKAPLQD